MTTAQPGQEQRMEPSAVERQVDAVIDAARNVEWEAHFGANWAGRAQELAKAREHLLAFAARPTADLGELEPDGTGIDTSPGSGNSPEEQRADVGGTQPRKAADLGEDGELVEALGDVLDIIAAAQAEFSRTDEHKAYYSKRHEQVRQARDRIELYREALEFYASGIGHREIEDGGAKARAVLSRRCYT